MTLQQCSKCIKKFYHDGRCYRFSIKRISDIERCIYVPEELATPESTSKDDSIDDMLYSLEKDLSTIKLSEHYMYYLLAKMGKIYQYVVEKNINLTVEQERILIKGESDCKTIEITLSMPERHYLQGEVHNGTNRI
jgi:hypothetical protein